MHSLVLILLTVAALAAMFACINIRSARAAMLPMANALTDGTHAESVTRLTDAAITTRHLLYKVGSDGAHVAACGVAEIPVGTIADEASAAEADVAVLLLGKGRTKLMVASEAITAGEAVYTAAAGKIQDVPSTTTATIYQVGYALTAAAADGDIIEVQCMTPIKTAVA